MLRRLRTHLSFANVTSSLSLFLVLTGGTAMAIDGSLPGQNTVGSEDIINGEVKSTDIANGRIFNVDLADNLITGEKLKDGTVSGLDIGNGTVGGSKIMDDTLTGLDVEELSLGKVPNADTLDGMDSSAFAPDKHDWYAKNTYVRSIAAHTPGGGGRMGTVGCDAGDHAISGGAGTTYAEDRNANDAIFYSAPAGINGNAGGWTTGFHNDFAPDVHTTYWAVCLKFGLGPVAPAG